jgi:hypothetical protein
MIVWHESCLSATEKKTLTPPLLKKVIFILVGLVPFSRSQKLTLDLESLQTGPKKSRLLDPSCIFAQGPMKLLGRPRSQLVEININSSRRRSRDCK